MVEDILKWKEIVGAKVSRAGVVNAFSYTEEEFMELKKAVDEDNKVEVIDAVIDLIWTSLEVAYCTGVSKEDILKAIVAVSENNWSKVFRELEAAKETVDFYEKEKRVKVFVESVGVYPNNFYIVKRFSDSKVMKPKDFVKVDLSFITILKQ